jgi:LmbE family N-acetylglucosaminyl deacetylase
MRIMAFSPHPDDVEIFCSGTLAKYKAHGHDVGVVLVTNGNVGSPTLPPAEIAAIRVEESRAAAAILGAEFFFMGYDDEFLYDSPDVRRHFIDVIRAFRPDIVLCPDKDNDYIPDHTRTGQLVWDTHKMITVPNIRTEHVPTEKIHEIWYYDTLAGINFTPEFYVDITDHWETKLNVVRCHKSQDEWLVNQYGTPTVYYVETQNRFRGFQTGCTFAEAFRRAHMFPQAVQKDGLLPSAYGL